MTTERTATINALTALLRVVDLGIDARKPLAGRQVNEVARWRARVEELAVATARAEAVRLAKRILALDEELAANQAQMTGLIRDSKAAMLLDKTGIGPITVTVALAAWSHSGRVRSEAAFAALAGVNPIPASSGNTTHHRPNRGGDLRLNQALHRTVNPRLRRTAPCRRMDYQGDSPSLKRHLSRGTPCRHQQRSADRLTIHRRVGLSNALMPTRGTPALRARSPL